jgi:branched-chain amino acid transport system ATP-binding protein
VLVEGTPAAIRSDERVRAAYLGNMITGGRA